MHVDLEGVKAECVIHVVGLGEVAKPAGGKETKTQARLRQTYGPLLPLLEVGTHVNGSACQAMKLITWEALAELVGLAAVVTETLPADVRDQYRAHVAEVEARARLDMEAPRG